jgi:hypothetical protein
VLILAILEIPELKKSNYLKSDVPGLYRPRFEVLKLPHLGSLLNSQSIVSKGFLSLELVIADNFYYKKI